MLDELGDAKSLSLPDQAHTSNPRALVASHGTEAEPCYGIDTLTDVTGNHGTPAEDAELLYVQRLRAEQRSF